MWDTSLPDWEDRLLGGRSLVPDLPLYPEERDKALRIFNRLKLPDVIGQPPLGQAVRPWFKDVVAALFGSYDATTHRRMIQEVFLLVPKKNAKSTGAAGIMTTALIMNRRPGARFQIVAPTMKIAGISYRQARGMIKADDQLSKLFGLRDHVRTIVHRTSEAELAINAADGDVVTGSLVDGTLIDETHVFAKRANAADIFVEIRGALAARPDGFLIQITTQSKDVPSGVFKSELEMARAICKGIVKLPRLAVLYELPEYIAKEGGWKNPRFWRCVNPNLGLSVDEHFLRNALTAAEADPDPKKALALLASQHFNVQIGQGLQFDRWAGANYWEAAAEPTLALDELIRRSDVAVVGIDGGGLDDLLGVAVIGRDRVTRKWLIWLKAWAQDDVLNQRPENTPKLRELIAAGELVLCTDPTQDLREVADLVEQLKDADLLPEQGAVGLDPQGVAALVDELVSRGLTDEQLVAIPQGYKLSSAVWGLERKLKDKTAVHAGQALGAWAVGNAKTEQRGNAVLITKATAGKAKIDPLCAALNGVQLMGRNPVAVGSPELYVL